MGKKNSVLGFSRKFPIQILRGTRERSAKSRALFPHPGVPRRPMSHDSFQLVLVQLTSTGLKGNFMTYIMMRSVQLNTVCPAAQSSVCALMQGGGDEYATKCCDVSNGLKFTSLITNFN